MRTSTNVCNSHNHQPSCSYDSSIKQKKKKKNERVRMSTAKGRINPNCVVIETRKANDEGRSNSRSDRSDRSQPAIERAERESNDTTNGDHDGSISSAFTERLKRTSTSVILSCVFALSSSADSDYANINAFAKNTDNTNTNEQRSLKKTTKQTGDCLLQNCKSELAGCLADEKCVESLACLNVCFGKPDEADCQIRCGDLYASKAVQKFNTCAVTRNACVAQRQTTGEYPVPEFDQIEQSDKVTVDDWVNKKRWYIVAGLNKDFDIFDCQEHFFVKGEDGKMYIKINWRVNRQNGQFYERGDVQRFYEDDKKAIFLNRGNPETKLHYQDDWIIPKDGFYADEEKGVAFVYYRGTNDAWDGYGGAVVYATEPKLRPEFVPRMKQAAKKVNVDWSKMVFTDNSCKAQEDVKVTNVNDLDTLGDDVKAVEKVIAKDVKKFEKTIERDIEKITENIIGKDAERTLELDISNAGKTFMSEIKALEQNLFRLENATERKFRGPQRAFNNPDASGKKSESFDINLRKAEKKLLEVENEVRLMDPNTNGFNYYPSSSNSSLSSSKSP